MFSNKKKYKIDNQYHSLNIAEISLSELQWLYKYELRFQAYLHS